MGQHTTMRLRAEACPSAGWGASSGHRGPSDKRRVCHLHAGGRWHLGRRVNAARSHTHTHTHTRPITPHRSARSRLPRAPPRSQQFNDLLRSRQFHDLHRFSHGLPKTPEMGPPRFGPKTAQSLRLSGKFVNNSGANIPGNPITRVTSQLIPQIINRRVTSLHPIVNDG